MLQVWSDKELDLEKMASVKKERIVEERTVGAVVTVHLYYT